MTLTGRTVIAALALISMSACANTTSAKSWREFRVPGADFAVSMPSEPEVSDDTAAKDGTVSRSYHVNEGTIVYMVGYSTSLQTKKPAPLDGWLDNIRHDLIVKMKAKLREERRLTIGDARGIALVLELPESDDHTAYTMIARIYVKHMASGQQDALYQTLVVAEPGQQQEAAIGRFLDSFHFVKG